MEPKVNLKKVEVNDGAMDVEIESEEIVRFYVEHMKELFDSVKGADNYYILTMKFAGDGKQYTITFQRHPGKTPGQLCDEQIRELESKLAQLDIEAEERYEKAIDESYCYLIEKDLMPKKAKFQIAIQDALRMSARIASGKEES